MSLFGTIHGQVKDLLEGGDDVKRDNIVNKLHYQVTAVTLTVASLILSLQQVSQSSHS